MGTLGLGHYLLLSAALFGIGVIGVLARRNVIMVLMCLELIFNAANINLVAVARYRPDLAGQIFTIFTITVAAAEAAIGLGLVIAMFRNVQTVNVDDVHLLEG
ncbi:MAG TPA: NADH-quinone oxidoreductase subunit NuoK [Acidobacteriota bacterium]|nr:NADH-quinone oxidoreductase subunit NuoK [Acidobacteriota bacterium]